MDSLDARDDGEHSGIGFVEISNTYAKQITLSLDQNHLTEYSKLRCGHMQLQPYPDYFKWGDLTCHGFIIVSPDITLCLVLTEAYD